MPAKTDKIRSTAHSTTKKADTTAEASRILEEAPLFAGLDGFVFSKPENTTKEIRKKEPKARKARTEGIQTEQSEPEKFKTRQKPPKQQKAAASEAPNILLSVKEMCSLLKISRATLVRMDKSGQLPGRIKLGGSVRFHRETVDLWLQSLIQPPSSTS